MTPEDVLSMMFGFPVPAAPPKTKTVGGFARETKVKPATKKPSPRVVGFTPAGGVA